MAARITAMIPQVLVTDMDRAVTYYREQLGFELQFRYQSFYAGVQRDGFVLHLKCGEVSAAEREHRREHAHLDAFVDVSGVRELYDEMRTRGASITQEIGERPWHCVDFYVEDPDGNILCFSEPVDRAG